MDSLKNKEEIIKTLLEEGYTTFILKENFAAFNKYVFMEKYDFFIEVSTNGATPILFIKGSILYPVGNVTGCCKAVPFSFVNSMKMSFKEMLMNCMKEISDQLKDIF